MVGRLTIGEFARQSGLSVSALRFYDSAGLLLPAETDVVNGYRRYEPAQLAKARLIRDLRRLEMPLASIQTFLDAVPAVAAGMLDEHLGQLDERVRDAKRVAEAIRSVIAKEEPLMTMTVDGAELRRALDQVLPAAGADPERPTLFTVLVEARDGSLRLVATDSYRLAVRDLVAQAGHDTTFRTLVAAAGLARIRPALEVADRIEVGPDDTKLRLGMADGDVELPTVPAEFPAYETFFGSDPDASVLTIQRTDLLRGLEQAPVSDCVRLELSTAGSRIVDDPPIALAGDYEGEAMLVGLNPNYLRYAAESALGPDLRIELTTPTRPVLIKSATDSSFICMVMPIKVE